jgi:hypothetical protein
MDLNGIVWGYVLVRPWRVKMKLHLLQRTKSDYELLWDYPTSYS